MSILLPNLDDRRWGDLVEQGRALIPLYASEWTDHNASDPGITLMELLAWITETDVYRLNRVSARAKRRLLELLSGRPAPPRPARVVVAARVSSGPSPVALPATLEWTGTSLDGTQVLFSASERVELVASSLRFVQRRNAGRFQNVTAAWTRGDALPLFGDDPAPGAELYLGFEQPLPAHHDTQLFFHMAGVKAGFEERSRVVSAARQAASPAGNPVPPHHSARVTWEYLAEQAGPPRWLPLDADDHTRSFTLSGPVRLRPGGAMKAQAVGQIAQAACYVRCRFTAGAFDDAPAAEQILLNGFELVQSVPVWQTWPIAAGATVSGTPVPGAHAHLRLEMHQGSIVELAVTPDAGAGAEEPNDPAFLILAYVAPTATGAGSLTVQAAIAGTGTGEPGQTLTLGRRPVVEHTIGLASLEGTVWRVWRRVDDFAASTRADAHFQFDPTDGEITFGDGERGRTAPAGCLLLATCEATRADNGVAQVAAIADSPRNRVLLPDLAVIERIAIDRQIVSRPGEPAETLAHATGRAIELREASLRAVTAADFEAIALDTPGARIARAIARPNLYPGLDCVNAPGVVTVVVLPWLPEGRPVPSPGLIERVAARLERRRTIGTRVIVTGPRYLEVGVRARIQPFDGVDKRRLAGEISRAIDAFFHPLTGGPGGAGWPLGRDVYRSEVLQVIDETPGVDHVLSLELAVDGCRPTCGNVCLRPTWLVAAGRHELEVM